MFDKEKWQEIFSSLKNNKMRTTLTVFGVFWGIFMLIIMLGLGMGFKSMIQEGFGDFATNSLLIWPQQTTKAYKGFPRNRRYMFTNEDVQIIKEKFPEIEFIAPKLRAFGSEGANNATRGTKTGAFSVEGTFPEYNLIDPSKITSGRFVNNVDIEEYKKVAVIGKHVKDVLFDKDENPIGEYIKINGIYFKVVGVLTKGASNISLGSDKDRSIVIPLTTFQKVYNRGNEVGFCAVTAVKEANIAQVQQKINTFMRSRHSIAPDDEQAVGGFNLAKEFKKIFKMITGIGILIWIVGTATLLAGVIGVSNIMLVVVKERTKEIGIQRALGATPFKIMNNIITEAIFLTASSGYMGIVLGVGVIELIKMIANSTGSDNPFFTHAGVNLNVALMALFILVIFGVLAGFIPAKRAISIKPIDALRDE